MTPLGTTTGSKCRCAQRERPVKSSPSGAGSSGDEGDGKVEVSIGARYTTAKADEALTVDVTNFKASFFLVDAAGTETPLPIKGKWETLNESKKATITLPQVDDGDYLLRTKTTSKIGDSSVDLKLPLYAPARIHLLTDRPLYEPGNLVQFRALALRARDLSPIDNRPGTWLISDPSGNVLLEEKAPAKEWGVVAGDFPLADDADEGSWTVTWRSGQDEASTSFRVEPFVLPRFRVDSDSDKSYYQAGDSPVLTGAVVYSSGAPVAGAALEISWSASGAGHRRVSGWPVRAAAPSREWRGRSLQTRAAGGARRLARSMHAYRLYLCGGSGRRSRPGQRFGIARRGSRLRCPL